MEEKDEEFAGFPDLSVVEEAVEEIIDFRNLAALVAMHALIASSKAMRPSEVAQTAVAYANTLSCALEPTDDPQPV